MGLGGDLLGLEARYLQLLIAQDNGLLAWLYYQ